METTESFEKASNKDSVMNAASVTMPTGLLSVVDALCQGNAGGNDDDNESHNSDDKTSDDSTQSAHFLGDVNDDNKRDENENRNETDKGTTGFCPDGTGTCRPDTADAQSYTEKEGHGLEECVISKEIQSRSLSLDDSKTSQKCKTVSVNPSRSIDIPTYTIDDSRIVVVPDLYRVVREACGSCSPLRGLVNRLSIVPKRFDPFQMLRLKHVGAVSLEVKCCSYILLEEFLQVISRYKDKTITPDMLNILPAIDVSTSTEPVDNRAAVQASQRVLPTPSSSFSVHTFIVQDELVVCTVELQQVFESLFGNVFSMSLTKLGIRQSKFTPLQLDEVMDFVDIDEAKMSSAGFYIRKKDADRVFSYIEALFNVDQLQVKWLDPLSLSAYQPPLEDEKQLLEKDTEVENIQTSSQTILSTAPYSNAKEASEPVQESRFEKKDDDLERIVYHDEDWDGVPGKSFLVNKGIMPPHKEGASAIVQHSDTNFSLPFSQKKSQLSDSGELKQTDHPLHGKGGEPQAASSIDFMPLEDTDGVESSPGSEASLFSDTDSCSSICTYMIDDNEVVCIPDIHKIVIHLYGQSVQVGYYLQRLQIPTQRFSTVHVKRLKALHALNSKATLCTYILKSDALRLLKMYDVFCTESKLQQIQWNGPVSLEGIQSSQVPSDEVVTIQDNLSLAQEPIDVVKIPTFLIDGEIVVSVPDAHKVVQVLNGQSVQVRYNMDKLGIVKRRYSYSQVYQLRAISDLKRPSMCTFITKNDADKLLEHYLTAENASRLKYIQWLPPVRLEERHSVNTIVSQDGSLHGVARPDEKQQLADMYCYQGSNQTQEMKPREEVVSYNSPSERTINAINESRNSYKEQIQECSGADVRCCLAASTTNTEIPCAVTMESASNQVPCVVTMAEGSPVPYGVAIPTMSSQIPCSIATESLDEANSQQNVERCEIGKKRPYDALKDKDGLFIELKRLKDEKDDIAATLERKETEMRILHDAYQQQVVGERKKRLEAEKEIEELKASNAELCKNLQRKESEMKILHDSYQYQIRKEREKRQELETDLIDLRGSVAFASGVAIRDPKIKQENPL